MDLSYLITNHLFVIEEKKRSVIKTEKNIKIIDENVFRLKNVEIINNRNDYQTI